MNKTKEPSILILNQMAGPMTWELAEDFGRLVGPVALLTGHPDTLAKGSQESVQLFPATPYDRGGYLRRMFSWLRYLVHAFFWLWKWPRNVPLLLFSNPPLLPWLGYVMHILRGQRYAVMVHDIYPDILVRLGTLSEHHPITTVWRWCNRRAYEHAEVVMTLGEYMAATLQQQFDPERTKAGRIDVISPWADTNVIRPLSKEENWFAKKYNQVGKLTVMYSGNMGIGHDIEMMLEAAEKLQDIPDINFMFIGAGPKWELVKETVCRKKLANVTYLSWQPEEVIPYSLATADVALVSLEPQIRGLAVPSKAFSSLAAGVPLMVISDHETELTNIVKHFKCGWWVRPEQLDKFCQILLRLLSAPHDLNQQKVQSRCVAEEIGARKNSIALARKLHNLFRVDSAIGDMETLLPIMGNDDPQYSTPKPLLRKPSTVRTRVNNN